MNTAFLSSTHLFESFNLRRVCKERQRQIPHYHDHFVIFAASGFLFVQMSMRMVNAKNINYLERGNAVSRTIDVMSTLLNCRIQLLPQA